MKKLTKKQLMQLFISNENDKKELRLKIRNLCEKSGINKLRRKHYEISCSNRDILTKLK